jgi:hypothetical protein
MKRIGKKFLTMSLALAMTATTLFTPASVKAETNINKSVDDLLNSNLVTSVAVTLPTKRSEITIGVTGKYELKLSKIGLSQEALDAGFFVLNDSQIGYLNEKDEVVAVNVTWTSAKPAYVTTTGKGIITANKICKTKADGSYYRVPVYASIGDTTITCADGTTINFKDNAVAKSLVTVVPEEDLSVYFLGVWTENDADVDAQHKTDYAVTSANVVDQLKAMSEAVAEHCVGTSVDVVAYTKTNDGSVRAYLTTKSEDAGKHFYILTFSTSNKTNKINVAERDFCESEYSSAGSYYRDLKINK